MICFRLLKKLSTNQLFLPQSIKTPKGLQGKSVLEFVSFRSESINGEKAFYIYRVSFITMLTHSVFFHLNSYNPKSWEMRFMT